MTKKSNGASGAKKSSSRAKSVTTSVVELENVVSAAADVVDVPVGSGVECGGSAAITSGLSEEPTAHQSARESINDKLAASLAMGDDFKLLALRSAICSHFAAPEWARADELRAALSPLGLSDEAINAAILTAARKEGVNLSPIRCTVGRVLAVVRRYYKREFENLIGKSFETVCEYYRNGGFVGSYSLRLPLSLVRADSVSTDFLDSCALPADASAASVASAVLSLRFFFSFNFSLEGAKSAARVNLRNHLADVWRSASRLGLSVDDVVNELRDVAEYVTVSDRKERTQLTRNLENAWRNYNEINDEILRCGGACGDRAAKVAKLLARRDRFASVAHTCSVLLEK